jgi:hypothetical protein
MTGKTLLALRAAGFLAWLGLAGTASAGTMVTTLSDFDGALEIRVTLDDEGAGPGEIQVTVEVISGEADLRGVFLNVADDSLLPGMSAAGADVSEAVFAASSVIDLGQGANVNGGGPCPCDLGVELGTPGMEKDDIQLTSFVLSHESEDLGIGLFEGQTVMVRATSVGDELAREDSVKMAAVVPEPAATALVGSALALLAVRRRAGRSPQPTR